MRARGVLVLTLVAAVLALSGAASASADVGGGSAGRCYWVGLEEQACVGTDGDCIGLLVRGPVSETCVGVHNASTW